MIEVVVGIADQGLARQAQSQLAEMGDAHVVAVAATTREVSDALLAHDVDVALVHEALGPEPVISLLRDLTVRRPSVALVLVAVEPDAMLVTAAMEAGARAVLTLPLVFGQVDSRVRGAAAWSRHVRASLSGDGDPASPDWARARAIGIAGAKGGVGTTTVACHLAMDLVRSVSWARVCLIDLDLEKGDVPGFVEVRHRVGLSDLAKVADDLSAASIADSVTRHESGLDLLLAPVDVRDVEWVTPSALRQVLAAVRREYDVVVVDLGSHVTPAQATAVELVDAVVVVVTPDVPAVRGLRRALNAWDSLGVCKETDAHVLLNRVNRQAAMPPETIAQLTQATVLPAALPAAYRRLEPTANAREPLAMDHPGWWSVLRRLGRELGLLAADGRSAASLPSRTPAASSAASSPRSRRRRHGREADAGAVSIEALVAVPLFLMLSLIVWHMAALGVATGLQAHAAAAATRAVSLGVDAQRAAEAALPPAYRDGVVVSEDAEVVTVSLTIGGVGDLPGMPDRIVTDHVVVDEP